MIQVIYQQLVIRISSEVPNTEKLMKARSRRRSAFIVSRCLEPLMKYEARVVDITSQKKVEWRALNSVNESLFGTRKYENPVSMSLSGNCFERSKFHSTHYLLTGRGKRISFTVELSLESHPSDCFLRVFVVRESNLTFLDH